MARKNDLEVSPAQEAKDVQRVRARVKTSLRTNNRDEADTGENTETFRWLENDDARHSGTIDAGSRPGELDDDDAENLAGLINVASLSGGNAPSTKPADKPLEGALSRTFNTVFGFITGGSQKQAESFRGNNSPTGQLSKPQKGVKKSRDSPQELPDKPVALSGDKSLQGKTLARPNATYEDISKVQKSRRSGRPDPYDVPQSPPMSPVPESKPTRSKHSGPKPKRVIIKEKTQPLPMVSEVVSGSIEEETVEPQEHFEYIGIVRGRSPRAISAGEDRNAMPNRVIRHTRINAHNDLEESQQQHKQYQLEVIKQSREHLQSTSPTQSWASTSKGQPRDQGVGNQTGLAAADLVKHKNNVEAFSNTKTQSRNKGTMSRRGDPQLKGNVPYMPAKPHSDPETVPAQDNTPTQLNGISPILSEPTPAKGAQHPSRRLQRPSLITKAAQSRKSIASMQQLTQKHSVKSPASAQISEDTHAEKSDDEDNTQLEIDVRTAPTPRASANGSDVTDFIDEETLKQMRLIMQKAVESAEKRALNKKTSNGKILVRMVTGLISRYKTMKNLRFSDIVDIDRIDIEQNKVLKDIDEIRNNSQAVLTSRLGDPDSGERNADKMSRSHMLEDLYLYIIPGLVETLDCAVHSRQDQKALEISDLEELYSVLKIIYDLVEASRNEDKTIQPKAPGFVISQPTRKLRPIVRKLFHDCGKRLDDRKMAIKAEQIRQAMPERARKRKERLEEEQRKEEELFQQRLRERNKAIIASLDERRAELGLPPCSQSIAAPSTSQQPQTPKYRTKVPFGGIDRGTNIRLFGFFGSRQRNSHPGTKVKEWTVDEMAILVDGLRRVRGTYKFFMMSTDLELIFQGPTRYEKLASKLDRTLDEIFHRAKYLKMQMEYTLKRLQEENPNKEFPPIKPWIENIGSEGFLN
jgi:hypothetical protein